jgi:hypothetical protein
MRTRRLMRFFRLTALSDAGARVADITPV